MSLEIEKEKKQTDEPQCPNAEMDLRKSPTPLPLASPLLGHLTRDSKVLCDVEKLECFESSHVSRILAGRVSKAEIEAFERDFDTVDFHIRDTCSFHRFCHARAEVEDWQGMSCSSCRSYSEETVQCAVPVPRVGPTGN